MVCKNCNRIFTGPFCPICGTHTEEGKEKVSGRALLRARNKELFGVGTFQRILGWFAISLSVICFLFRIFGARLGLPENPLIFMPMFCFFVASGSYLWPHRRWALRKWQLSWSVRNTEDLEPTDLYVFLNHLSYYGGLGFGIFMTVMTFKFFHAP